MKIPVILAISIGVIFFGFNLFYLELNIFTVILTLFCIFSFFVSIRKFNLIGNFTNIFILLYIFLCHTILPFLVFIDFLEIEWGVLNSQNTLSLIYYLIFFSTYLLFGKKNKGLKMDLVVVDKIQINSNPWSDKYIYALIIISFLVSGFSFGLGIGKMGAEVKELPYKLTGIINYLRSDILPFLFVLFYIKTHKKSNTTLLTKYELLFIFWAIFEAFVRLSRSAFIEYLIPIIAYKLLSDNISLKRVVNIGIVILLINFSLYPLISGLRYLEGGVNLDNIKEANGINIDDQNQRIFKRTFSNAFYFFKYQDFVSNDLFDFRNAPLIILLKGSHHFTTIVVDNLGNVSNRHSSGTTGLMDAYLFGGAGLSYLLFFIVCILANRNDRIEKLDRPFNRFFVIFIIRWLVWYRSVSLIFDPSQLVVFFIIYLISKKH